MARGPVEENIEMRRFREKNIVDDFIRGEEGETSFINNNRVDDDVIIDTSIPNPRRDVGVMKRAIIQDKKNFLLKELGVKINKPDAPKLFDKMTLTEGGASYKGVDVLVTRDGIIGYNSELGAQRAVNEFKGLIEQAQAKYTNSAVGYVDKQVAKQIGVEPSEVLFETSEEVVDRMKVRLDEEIETRTDKIVTGLTGNELSEFHGLLDSKELESVIIQERHWRDLAEKTSDKAKKELYEAIAEVGELKADRIRLGNNEIPKSKLALEIMLKEIRDSDMTRFQRFRKWARKNMGSAAAIAISIGGIITTIIKGGRKFINEGIEGLKNLAKSLYNLSKNLGNIIGSLVKLISKIIAAGANGLSFLAENLWLLAVLFTTYIIYNKGKEWLPKRKS